MSLYSELITESRRFVQGATAEGTRPVDSDLPTQVEAILLRTGRFKFEYMAPLYEMGMPRDRLLQLAADSDETREFAGRPALVAAQKVKEDTLDIREIVKQHLGSVSNEKVVLSVGNDVQVCGEDGLPIYRPEIGKSKEEVYLWMVHELSTDRTFRVKSGLSAYGRNGHGSQPGDGTTISIGLEDRFAVQAFSPEQIELYIFGLAGRTGNFPQYLEIEFQKLIDERWIDPGEREFYAQGMSVDELYQTNGGFRWPHPIFLRQIAAVNGFRKGDEMFNVQLHNLFLSLIGAHRYSLPFLEEAVEEIKKGVDKRMVVLKDGSKATVRAVNLANSDDLLQVSNLIIDNFWFSTSYRDLGHDQVQAYSNANSPEEVYSACSQSSTLAALSIEQDGEIIGFSLLRVASNDRLVAEIRRFHTKIDRVGLGIGSIMEEELRLIAREAGVPRIAVLASGTSYDNFFGRKGYKGNGVTTNEKMASRGVLEAKVYYAERTT